MNHCDVCVVSAQVEPDVLRHQRGQLRVQRGALLLGVGGRPGRLLLPPGRPGAHVPGPLPRGQRVQRRLLVHQHLLGLVRQRVRVAGGWSRLPGRRFGPHVGRTRSTHPFPFPPSPLSCQEVTSPAAAMSCLTSFPAFPVHPVCSPRGSPSPTPTATWTSCHGVP